jgi:hypothetical protein
LAKEFALTLPQIDQFLDQFEVLKDTIINSPIESYPFPHIFIDKALNEFTLQKLWDDLPQDKDFDQIKNGGYILKNHSLQSYSWNAYDAFIRFTLINLLPKFKDWLEIKNNELIKLNMSCSRIRQYDSFLCFTDPARGVPPHIDGESSIISILTVLGYQNGSPAPVTNFFLKDSASEHYFPTTKYQPCRGSIFVWLNLANSYHGVIEKVYPKRLTHVASIESYEKYD